MKLAVNVIKLMALALLVAVLVHPLKSEAAVNTSAPDLTMTIGNVKGYVGDTVDVPVKINKPNKGIAAYGVELNYDSSALEVVGIKEGYGSGDTAACSQNKEGCFWSSYDNSKGYLRTAWADTTAGDHPITETTTLFTVEFKIKDGKKLGANPLTVDSSNKESLSFSDVSNHPLNVEVENGQLTTAKSSNADLSSLQLSNGKLTPAFSKTVDTYKASVAHSVDSISIATKAEDAHSTVTINGKPATDQYSLETGDNTFKINVQAQDGTSKDYTIKVTREKDQTTVNNQTDSGKGTHASTGTSQTDSSNGTHVKTLPKTGDDSYIDRYLNIGIGAVTAAILITLVIYYRKKRMTQD
ncbi:cohesin domain-containing protein [Pullulanibacillus sp. KACC 23026]|uniref:cohesin domain-containing protein n=1 Tax=Pullulanibacillus sp. KACC 23026 TaxID=3028315 RepID=UPI0023AF3518|nr:cohesin domain-containing protein [Pullulanibacillus sp. KACC 23026]WEG13456.1 cohesin domain-containing protein [Pullulanibacillus sp. KACC 23026]